ncbi:hypothetical protein SOCE26_046140 [Sorangium cellulosum]|uniref:PEGA domain-containing protein n=1 Tax=Sorangium cellulosum TaxID=56 RepID=A0A2L0EV52_SORCE|nr:hypothetical protein [Sorangium cellulosum]AUX43171.1 hypothetical protein SOCE26_046140 [Sorangium cellulosum]
MARRLGIASLLLVLTCAPAAALAQVSDADRATARSLAVEGQEALDRKDFSAAFDRFGRADAIIHAPTLLLGVARAQVGLGRWIAAQESYNRILREGAPEGSPEPFFQAIDAAHKELDALAPRIPQVLITVRGTVRGSSAADVTIDGEPVPRAALGVKRPVDPGEHTIRATGAGLAPAEVKVTLAEGASETVVLELKPLAPPPATPIAPAPDRAGPVAAGSGRTVLGIAALGLGGVGLATGAVSGVLALNQHADLSERCPGGQCDPSLQGDVDRYHVMGTVSTLGFAIGAAAVGAGVLLLVTAPSSPQRSGLTVTPVIGLGCAGAKGRF